MPLSIRLLADADLARANAILQSAFQRSESWLTDLQLFDKLQPDGVCLACQHEIPLGMVAAIKYPTFAYVGLMGVHQESQRQGVGLALMQHILAWLDQEGVHQVLLDASPLGQPLYEKLGFVARDDVPAERDAFAVAGGQRGRNAGRGLPFRLGRLSRSRRVRG